MPIMLYVHGAWIYDDHAKQQVTSVCLVNNFAMDIRELCLEFMMSISFAYENLNKNANSRFGNTGMLTIQKGLNIPLADFQIPPL